MKKFRMAAAALAAAVLLQSAPVKAAAPGVSARCAVLMDAASGRVLMEKNADEENLIASTTKIMTGLLAAEAGDLETTVEIPAEAVGIEGSSLYLRQGEELTREQLLYGMMLRSGNDAAMALAISIGGDVEQFVARMNRRASELGLRQTHFANPHGLDDAGNYSTARELALLARAAMENETFCRVVSTKEYRFGERVAVNHNKLLWQYPGAVGVKTGYTKAAGRLLVSAAEREGRLLIAVTINAPNDWADHTAMLDYGFAQLSPRCLSMGGSALGAVEVIGGDAVLATCVQQGDLVYPMLEGEEAELRLSLPRFVYAPLQKGKQAGWVQAVIGEKVVAQAPLVWRENVSVLIEEPKGFLERLFDR